MKGANMNLPTRVFDPFKNMTVGFDNIFDQLSTLSDFDIPNYPPYNIKKIDKENYQLEMALAGFTKADVCLLYTSPSPRDQRGSRMASCG